jgi:hypothetical protein
MNIVALKMVKRKTMSDVECNRMLKYNIVLLTVSVLIRLFA